MVEPQLHHSTPPGFIVNNKLFFNRHLAHVEQVVHGGEIKFDMFDYEFSKHNWKKDPELSFEELIDIRALQIRESNDVVVMWFSGGTDSITMYNAFIRNNLHIDEIIVRYWPGREHFGINDSIITWLHKNHSDSKTVITTIDQTRSDIMVDMYNSDNWMLSNIGRAAHHSVVIWASENLQQKYENKKWVQLHGFEKPNLVYRNGKFSAWHLDKIFHSTLGHPNMEYFYITPDLPELHIKQCHMLKNYIKQCLNDKLYEDFRSELLFSLLDQQLYMGLSVTGCGRHGEIIPTICVHEKKLISSKKIIWSSQENYNKLQFSGYQSTLHNNYAEFMQPWYKGRLEINKSILGRFMVDNNLITDVNDPFSFCGMYSKQYELE